MLENFFDGPLRVKTVRSGLSGRLLEGFAEDLCQTGYTKTSLRTFQSDRQTDRLAKGWHSYAE